MKKMILAIAAAMMMSANVMAQGNQQRPQMDPAEMMKARTEQMVKEYGLNEEQAKKLEVLNTNFAQKMPMMGGQRGQGQRTQGQTGQRQRGQGQTERDQRPQRQQGDTIRRGERPQGQGQRGQMNFEEMRKNMEEYNAELQKIMTEEQFKKYTENNQRRMGQRGQRGGNFGGQRPQRNN